MEKRREPGMDNLRGGLMLCVVMGHLLEWSAEFPGRGSVYTVLYSFHMPAFLFLSGYFSRFRPGRIFWGTVWPYLIFQPLYLLFAAWLTGSAPELQLHTPYWILWYLAVLAWCQVMIPVYDRFRGPVLAAAAAAALLGGYFDAIGFRLGLNRLLAFQVWFILGYAWKQGRWDALVKKYRLPLGLGFGAVAVGAWLALILTGVPARMLYGAYPYAALGYGPGIRGLGMLAALGAIGAMMLLARPILERPIPILTMLGQNTMPVYLLHGFGVLLIGNWWPGLLSTPLGLVFVGLALTLALGNPIAGKALGTLLSDKWWRALTKERKTR